jgi:hypothetical protein
MIMQKILQSVLIASCFAQRLFAASASSISRLTRSDRILGAYYGSLVSDALTLGSHYEYDAAKIKLAYNGEITKYMAPGEQMGGETHGIGWGSRNYHPGAKAGDQTDYGEYNVLVLEHLATQTNQIHQFDVQEFLPIWQNRLSSDLETMDMYPNKTNLSTSKSRSFCI